MAIDLKQIKPAQK